MLVQLFKLLSAEGARQLASRSGRKINSFSYPLKKKAYMIQCRCKAVKSSKSTIFCTLPTGKYLAFVSENAPNVGNPAHHAILVILQNAPAETKILFFTVNETSSRSPCMRPSSDPPKMKNSTQTTLPHFNFSVTAELNDVTRRLA